MELHFYDFDGTLFKSPDKPKGWSASKSWAYDPQSLDYPCVPKKPGSEWWNGSVVNSAKRSIADGDVYAVMATGRADNRFRWVVPELLKGKGLIFDEVHLNPGGDTGSFKRKLIKRTLARYPFIDTVRIWDDQSDLIASYVKMIEGMGLTVESTHIKTVRPLALCDARAQPRKVARLVQRYIMAAIREARLPTDESKQYRQDEQDEQGHKGSARADFIGLIPEIKKTAVALSKQQPDKSKHPRLLVKALKTNRRWVAYLDKYIGTTRDHPKAGGWRSKVSYAMRDMVLKPSVKMGDVLQQVTLYAGMGFRSLTMSEAQAPLRDVVPSSLREFLPKNIVVEVDDEGTIQHVTDRFENEHLTLGKKIGKMRDLVAQYNVIAKRVKRDLKSRDEVIKLSALITAIIMETGIRPGKIGNGVIKTVGGEKVTIETFGAITLGAGHVRFIRDNFAELEFKGKKGGTNTASLSDAAIIKVLNDYVAKALKSGTPYIFVTAKGQQFSYSDLQRYFRENFGDVSPTDFRKLKATETVLSALRDEQASLYDRIRGFAKTAKAGLAERIVAEIVVTFEAAIARAQGALSHDSAATTLRAYINPEIILRFLSTGRVDDSLETAILSGESRLAFDPMAFVKASGGKMAGGPQVMHSLPTEGRVALVMGDLLLELRGDMEDAGIRRQAAATSRVADRWMQAARTSSDATKSAGRITAPPEMVRGIADWAKARYAEYALHVIAQDSGGGSGESPERFLEDVLTLEEKESMSFRLPDGLFTVKNLGGGKYGLKSPMMGVDGIGYDQVKSMLGVMAGQGAKKSRDLEAFEREVKQYTSRAADHSGGVGTTVPLNLRGWKYLGTSSSIVSRINQERKAIHAKINGLISQARSQKVDWILFADVNKDFPGILATSFRDQWEIERQGMEVPREFNRDLNAWLTPVSRLAEAKPPFLGKDDVMSALKADDWSNISVTFMVQRRTDFQASWGGMGARRMVLVAPPLDIAFPDLAQERFRGTMADLDVTVTHESIHMAQDLLSSLKGIGAAGVPSKKTKPKVDLNDLYDRTRHQLLDKEFYTELSDAVFRFQRHLRGRSPTNRDIQGFIADDREFFAILKKYAPARWRKAVSEFTKEVTAQQRRARRVAKRWVQAAGTAADITRFLPAFQSAYNDMLAAIGQSQSDGLAGTDITTRRRANVPWVQIMDNGYNIANGILSTRSIPARMSKGLEMAYRLLSTSRRMPKDVYKWWAKNQKRLLLIIQGANKWPEKVEGGDELFVVGSFKVHNTVGATGPELKSLKDAIAKVEKLAKSNPAPGFARTVYGDIHVVSRITKAHHAAWYHPGDDSLYLRRGKTTGMDEVQAMVHELGHRYTHKFASKSAMTEWAAHHRSVGSRPSDVKVEIPKVGDPLPGFKVPGVRGDPIVSRDDGANLIFDVTVRGKPRSYTIGRFKVYKLLKGKAEVVANFPTPYSATSADEHFCEAASLLAMRKLSAEHVEAFNRIWN